jgi:predicted dehydrogenase
MRKITAALVGAGQRGMDTYGLYALQHPDELQFTAAADPDRERREEFMRLHAVSEESMFSDWEELLREDRLADLLLICTQDNMHFEPAMAALKKGYHILLEKPISKDPEECLQLAAAAEQYGRHVIVAHVLRYTEFFTQIKQLVETGTIGEVVSIHLIEKVAFWHQAHSFVRGNWRRADLSSPMILAKSCHDMDVLLWLAGSDCRLVASFGSLTHFTEKNAPPDAPAYCLDGCPQSESCPFYAPRFYLDGKDSWQASILRRVVSQENRDAAVLEALKSGPYGRCVYRCDNDVVDHQVVSGVFENGATFSFTMSAFTADGGREIYIMGTKGDLQGVMEEPKLVVTDFLTQERTEILLDGTAVSHGGGDAGIMRDMVQLLQTGEASSHAAAVNVSVQSHLMALAAEKARVEHAVIDMADYVKEFSS